MNNIGQLIISGIEGTVLSLEEKKFIQKENIGGVILFDNNFESITQLCELTNQIQSLRKDIPFFIAVDHEGGRVIRFRDYFTQFPSAMEIGNLNSPQLCFEVHKVMGKEL